MSPSQESTVKVEQAHVDLLDRSDEWSLGAERDPHFDLKGLLLALDVREIRRPGVFGRLLHGWIGDVTLQDVPVDGVRDASDPFHDAESRALALGQTKAVAFLVPDLANPTFQAVLFRCACCLCTS